MRAAIYILLSNDATLMATLTGGLYSPGQGGTPADEISRQTTPAAFDANGELKPCGLVRLETETPWGPYSTSARLYVQVLVYQRTGVDKLDAARRRIYALLHRQAVIPVVDGGCWELVHAGDTLDQEDTALGARMVTGRYVATIRKA